jgi:hypothetical protein
MNLFLSTRSLTSSKEDHLTEFLAAALHYDSSVRRSYARVVLSDYARRRGWGHVTISEVSTQASYDDARCRPDLLIRTKCGKTIACEHKIESPETMDAKAEEDELIGQLERYLGLPVDGVAYFRATWKPPADAVLRHANYIRPADREHFLWEDLYPGLIAGASDVAGWLSKGFEVLGYTPPHPSLAGLDDPDPDARTEAWKNFAKLWGRTRSALHGMGWKVTPGSIRELYLDLNQASIAKQIYVGEKQGGRRLLVRVTPIDGSDAEGVAQRMTAFSQSRRPKAEIEAHDVPRAHGRETVVDVWVAIRDLLGSAQSAETTQRKLHDHVVGLVRSVEPPQRPS